MPKLIKINPNGDIEEMDNLKSDPDYTDNVLSGYILKMPDVWKHKHYSITIFIVDKYDDRHELNPLATHIFRTLRRSYGPVDTEIKGFMYMLNEDQMRTIDFTLKDFKYILSKCKNIKYQKQDSKINMYLPCEY